jgi:hypothetical protein
VHLPRGAAVSGYCRWTASWISGRCCTRSMAQAIRSASRS